MKESFDQLPLKQALLENLRALRFDFMTPVQSASLPSVLAGKDVLAQAKTGSGKTAAFALGILNSLDTSSKSLNALVLCPTRELAEQVAKEIRDLARTLKNVNILTLCGGLRESVQESSLDSGVHIVVGTPGRVLSLLEKGTLNVDSINSFTLDEADRMLDMGFLADIRSIVAYLPKVRQSLLFSATYPHEVIKLSEEILTNAVTVKVDLTHDATNLVQLFYELRADQDKNDLLYKVLAKYRPDRLIVFCKTKKETTDVAQFLAQRGISADTLNGDLEQNERTKVLTKFSNESLSVLVATDVAARGLDVENLAAIVNYDMPSGAEAYIHRIGRTGRAGAKGLAISFFSPAERFRIEEIEDYTGAPCNIELAHEIGVARKYDLIPPMQTIYISGGKKDKLRPGDILGALIGEAKLEAKDIGKIAVLNVLTFVAIRRERVDQAVEKLKMGKIKKKKYKVGLT